MNIPKCEHPIMLINKQLSTLYPFIETIHLGGMVIENRHNSVGLESMLERNFRRTGDTYTFKGKPITPDLSDQYYCTTYSGYTISMFQLVPCGKCLLCHDTYCGELASRVSADMEYFSRSSRPLFVTLTYDENHLPADGMVSKRELQLFLKRLRKNAGWDTLRYMYCGEYGSRHGRPHYHLMLWNLPTEYETLSDCQFMIRMHALLMKAWQYRCIGRCLNIKIIDMKKNNKCSKYVAKYALKTRQKSKDDPKRGFIGWSRGTKETKGLGRLWLEKHKTYITAHYYNKNFKMIFRNGSAVLFGRYFNSILFPSYAKLVPKDTRYCVSRLQDLLDSNVYDCDLSSILYQRLRNDFGFLTLRIPKKVTHPILQYQSLEYYMCDLYIEIEKLNQLPSVSDAVIHQFFDDITRRQQYLQEKHVNPNINQLKHKKIYEHRIDERDGQ